LAEVYRADHPSALIVAILWVVLAKPGIDSNEIAPHLFDPGVLGDRLRHFFGETRTPTP
jgi:hypothetical protein